ELRVDHVVVLLGLAFARRAFAACRAFGALLRLVHRLAQLHRRLRQGLRLLLDIVGIVALQRFLQRRDRVLDGGAFARIDLVAVLGERLLGRMDQRVALVLGLGGGAALLVLGRVASAFLTHLLIVGVRKTPEAWMRICCSLLVALSFA